MRIMHNIPALQSYNALARTNDALSKSINRLSTGLRINSAADDAAGLAISEKMRSQISGLDQATRNAQDGISMIQTAEGALGEVHSMLQRMRELAVQAANDTVTQEDRSYIQIEVDQLKEEINRISSTTQFNRKQLLDGSAGCIWSTSNLDTKVIVNGGLRTVDQFGQKGAAEGNFKITIDSMPGKAQVQKSDLFKIKHPNVIMDVTRNAGAGINAVRVDSLPAGNYEVKMTVGKYNAAAPTEYNATQTTGEVHGAFIQSKPGVEAQTAVDDLLTIKWEDMGIAENQSILMEVVARSDDPGAESVTFRVQIMGLTVDGQSTTYSESNFLVDLAHGISGDYKGLGWDVPADKGSSFKLKDAAAAGKFTVGDKIVFNVTPTIAPGAPATVAEPDNWTNAARPAGDAGNPGINQNLDDLLPTALVPANDPTGTPDKSWADLKAKIEEYNTQGKDGAPVDDGDKIDIAAAEKYYNFKVAELVYAATTKIEADMSVKVSGELNSDWNESWKNGKADPAKFESNYNVNAASFKNNEVHFKQFYINEGNGTTYEGSTVLTFSDDFGLGKVGAAAKESTVAASFEAAFIGQVAKGDVQLRDLDKFWDANGKFLLDSAQTLTMIQGDGTKASYTIYATDTLEEVRRKMNDTIADGLGQGKYSPQSRNNFVTFVDKKNRRDNTDVSVESTFVIRSIVPGKDGEISFSGDENIIRAFSLNTIQQSKESQFRVAVYDAHSGATVASNVKISGNVMYGIVAPNIDVRFDPMADIEAIWNENTQRFDLMTQSKVYETIVHLTDNSTIFQIGANESEDMSVDIGDMSARALGIMNLNVSDRENAARALGTVDTAIGLVSKQRAKLGAYQNRLEYTVSNLTTASTNTSAAESRIRDVDMAKEMMEFTKLNILSQAGNSMLAQANNLPNNVMSLLRG